MKPTKFKKLKFQKETIADLHSKELNVVHGGMNYVVELTPRCLTYTKCMTQCPSNDTAPLACCALC